LATEKPLAKPVPVELISRAEIWRIVGGIAILIIGSLLGLSIILLGLFYKSMDWEGYHKAEFPWLIVTGAIIVLVTLVAGPLMTISAIVRRKKKRAAYKAWLKANAE